ncbi:MAG: DUF2442 domain-containing protein [Paludibacteraceae bacterium]|jgi:hypothetical protein|nr:DUF2442 domain-containing protein [Paludibacteraceae bacterium]
MILKIIKAEYIKDYILRVFFSNGAIKYVNFAPLSKKGICCKLSDMTYFKNFTLDPFSIDWNNEIGFAPEYLLAQGIEDLDQC